MNVLLVTLGSHGDVHPFVGIGVAMQRRGHRATLLTNPNFAGLAAKFSMGFVPLGTVEDYHRLMHDPRLWHRRKALELILEAVAESLPK
ncbi:MAG: glycosyltransferase, partial [Tepidisphaeraceae bacterium]